MAQTSVKPINQHSKERENSDSGLVGVNSLKQLVDNPNTPFVLMLLKCLVTICFIQQKFHLLCIFGVLAMVPIFVYRCIAIYNLYKINGRSAMIKRTRDHLCLLSMTHVVLVISDLLCYALFVSEMIGSNGFWLVPTKYIGSVTGALFALLVAHQVLILYDNESLSVLAHGIGRANFKRNAIAVLLFYAYYVLAITFIIPKLGYPTQLINQAIIFFTYNLSSFLPVYLK